MNVAGSMNSRFRKETSILTVILILLTCFLIPSTLGDNYEKTYSFQAQYGLLNQKLYVSVTPSLYDFYVNSNHTVNTNADYANYITPQAVAPIAASIENKTKSLPYSDEQFADAVLTLVHQVTYNVTNIRYPVETIVDNSGDCVSLSLLAASIMQAGGLDVVLILYTGINPSHMNVGVYLPYTPVFHSLLLAPTSFSYDNKTYWTAEATPDADWKVGDQSSSLAGATVTIIPLNNNTIECPPAQISSSLGAPLPPSSINVNLSSNPLGDQENNTRSLVISGSVTPAISGADVIIYLDNGTDFNYSTVVTDDLGEYSTVWNFTATGTYNIRTSWSGPPNYEGSDSEMLQVFVGPESVFQFSTPFYNYIYEQTSFDYYLFGDAAFEANYLSPLQGVKNFLTVPFESNVSISADFMILHSGHAISNVPTTTVTIPASQQPVIWGERYASPRQGESVLIPSQTITVPASVPAGYEPLVLPDDFNQTVNDQFCFVVQDINGTYNLNLNALSSYDVANVTQDGSGDVFMNATNNVMENTWYTVKASIFGDSVIANLYNTTDGSPIGSTSTSPNGANLVMLLADDTNSAVVFKNISFQATNSASNPNESGTKTINAVELSSSPLLLIILLIVTLTVTVVYIVKKRRPEESDESQDTSAPVVERP